jgi:hypothetical protein
MDHVRCNFCSNTIQKSRVSAHYRYNHRRNDLRTASKTPKRRRRTQRTPRHRLRPPPPPPPPEDCVMCLEPHHNKLIPCNHTSSCEDCLGRWWRESYRHPRCPICRTETTTVLDQGLPTSAISDWQRWRRNDINPARILRRHFRRWAVRAFS